MDSSMSRTSHRYYRTSVTGSIVDSGLPPLVLYAEMNQQTKHATVVLMLRKDVMEHL
jgi:hypothetical protein